MTDWDRLAYLISLLAHPYSGANLAQWEREALALLVKLETSAKPAREGHS